MFGICFAIALALCVVPGDPPIEPAPVANDGWVTDLAHVLRTSEEPKLERALETYKMTRGHEVVVLTVPSLSGWPIDVYAKAVARQWSVGGRDRGDGALIVVAQAEHMVHIDAGAALASDLDDEVRGRIVRELMVPEFKRGSFLGGFEIGADAIMALADGDPSPLEQSLLDRSRRSAWIVPIVIVLLAGLGWRSFGGRRKAAASQRNVVVTSADAALMPTQRIPTFQGREATGKW